jgi:hypothetical protein
MAKKDLGDLEKGNKNIGGSVKTGLISPSNIVKAEEKIKADDSEKSVVFSLNIPIEAYMYIRSLSAFKTKEGNFNYNIKSSILEGIQLLKIENPMVSDEKNLERRFYKGGVQKNKANAYGTSITIPRKIINWIDNYILQERMKDEFFSKYDFINNLIAQLQKKYGKDI